MAHLRVGQQARGVEHRVGGHARLLQPRRHLVGGVGRRPRAQQFVELVVVLVAAVRGGEAGVARPRQAAGHPSEGQPGGVVRHGDSHVWVAAPARVGATRCGAGVAVAGPLLHVAAQLVVEHEGAEQRRRRLELGHVDEAALAGEVAVLKGGEHADHGVKAGDIVGRGGRGDPRGLSPRLPGQVVEADEGCLVGPPRHELVVGQGGVEAEPGPADVDEVGPQGGAPPRRRGRAGGRPAPTGW